MKPNVRKPINRSSIDVICYIDVGSKFNFLSQKYFAFFILFCNQYICLQKKKRFQGRSLFFHIHKF